MKFEAKNAVLRIAIRSTEDQDTWILEGRLAGLGVYMKSLLANLGQRCTREA
jgi:hypothetical protein